MLYNSGVEYIVKHYVFHFSEVQYRFNSAMLVC